MAEKKGRFEFDDKLKEGAKKVGGEVKEGAEKIGEGAEKGLKKGWGKTKEVGKGLKNKVDKD